jgi:hypothetical protein
MCVGGWYLTVFPTLLLLLLPPLPLLLQVREDGVVVEQAAGCGGFGKGERPAVAAVQS